MKQKWHCIKYNTFIGIRKDHYYASALITLRIPKKL